MKKIILGIVAGLLIGASIVFAQNKIIQQSTMEVLSANNLGCTEPVVVSSIPAGDTLETILTIDCSVQTTYKISVQWADSPGSVTPTGTNRLMLEDGNFLITEAGDYITLER